ncbi:hypothetical protein RIF29_21899 [Crotalaria pallida]|uniref:Uncharacterized protein n=1 Tax=Crotalaria pallida TaxID=3830 RepID=A0AAN9I7L0_CROPI
MPNPEVLTLSILDLGLLFMTLKFVWAYSDIEAYYPLFFFPGTDFFPMPFVSMKQQSDTRRIYRPGAVATLFVRESRSLCKIQIRPWTPERLDRNMRSAAGEGVVRRCDRAVNDTQRVRG